MRPVGTLMPRHADVSARLSLNGVLSGCLADNWSRKALGRKTTGSGRCRYLKNMPRRAKNGFREGAAPVFDGGLAEMCRCRNPRKEEGVIQLD